MNIIIFVIIAFIVIYFLYKLAKTTTSYDDKEKRKAGTIGEETAKCEIKRILHKDDIHFTNIELSYNGKDCEIDNLIVNQNGIFIIEVKNYNGSLIGDIDDYNWTKNKISPNGYEFTEEIKNPIKQVKRQQYILGRILSDRGVKFRNKGYVYLVNKNNSISSEYIIKDITLLEQIIHTPQTIKLYQGTINKIKNIFDNLLKDNLIIH